MSDCWIGLGANLGDARAAFDAAWSLLRNHPQIEVRQRSGLYRTAPVGAHASEAFLNAVGGISTTLAPLELLDVLQSIESTLGRTRDVRWGPRTLDLDLLFVDQQIIHEPRLTVPHPAAWYRRFVLDPLLEIAPTFRYPGLSALFHPEWPANLQDIHLALRQRPLILGYATQWNSYIEPLRQAAALRFPDVLLVVMDGKFESPVLCLQSLNEDGTPGPTRMIPVPELVPTEREASPILIDFLTAVFDEPERIGDW